MEPFTSNYLESRSKEESNKQEISSYTSMNIKMKRHNKGNHQTATIERNRVQTMQHIDLQG